MFTLLEGGWVGLTPHCLRATPLRVTENFGVGVGFGSVLVKYHICFLSNEMPQKLWVAGALPQTPLGSLQCSPRPYGGEGARCPSPITSPAALGSTGLEFGPKWPALLFDKLNTAVEKQLHVFSQAVRNARCTCCLSMDIDIVQNTVLQVTNGDFSMVTSLDLWLLIHVINNL